MISLDEFKNKLGDEVSNYSEEELIKLKKDIEGLADLLIDDYVDKLREGKKA